MSGIFDTVHSKTKVRGIKILEFSYIDSKWGEYLQGVQDVRWRVVGGREVGGGGKVVLKIE